MPNHCQPSPGQCFGTLLSWTKKSQNSLASNYSLISLNHSPLLSNVCARPDFSLVNTCPQKRMSSRLKSLFGSAAPSLKKPGQSADFEKVLIGALHKRDA